MAGFFYAIHRALRLRPALEATVISPKWLNLKDKRKILDRAAEDVRYDVFWKQCYVLLRSIWPLLKLLRLSDTNTPGMDKMYYLAEKAMQALKKSKKDLEDTTLFGNDECSMDIEEDGKYSDSESEEDEGLLETSGLGEDADASSSGQEEEEEEDSVELTLHDKMMKSVEKRMGPLGHDYAILGWICSVHPDVRKDVKTRSRKNKHGGPWAESLQSCTRTR